MAMAQASQLLRIGTRGSPLALAQARAVAQLLASKFSPDCITLQVIRTTGDMIRDGPLAEAGGKVAASQHSLFNHLVGTAEQRRRYLHAKRFRCFEVDD